MNILLKFKGYLIAAGVFFTAILAAVLKGMSIQKTKTKMAQKDVEIEAHKLLNKARKKAGKKTRENNEKADNGDFSGFNR